MTAIRRSLAAGVAGGLLLAGAAGADSGRYVARSYTQPARSGLAVSAPLAAYRAVARGRVVLPSEWSALRAPAGQLRFLTRGNPSCRYRVTFSLAVRIEPTGGDPAAYLAGIVPAAGPRYVLDTGSRGSAAFRVVRRPGLPTGLDARWTAPLTRRGDIVAPGRTAWADIAVQAVARPGDECHSGTWRQSLGPQLGDALATARVALAFVKG